MWRRLRLEWIAFKVAFREGRRFREAGMERDDARRAAVDLAAYAVRKAARERSVGR